MGKVTRIYKMYEQGVKLYISGSPATPQMVEKILLRGENSFKMPDICYDENGNISELHF